MSEWKEYNLGDVAGILNGYAFKSDEFSTTGIPVIKIKNVASGSLRMDDVQYYPYEITEKIRKFQIRKKDILIAMTGSHITQPSSMVGRSCRYDLDDVALLNQRVGKLFSKNENQLDEDFLFYFFKQDEIASELALSAGGSANQANISSEQIRKLDIYLPPLPEQKSIASVLSSLDDKIDLLHRQNKTSEALAETLFRQWFVDEGWETGTIEDEFDFTMGQSPPGSSYNESGKGMVFFQGRTDFGFRFPEPRVYTTEPNRLAKTFDTLISVRAPVGDINMAMEECCLGRGVAAFRYKHNPTFHTYTYYKLRSLMAQIKQFEDSGTVFGAIGKDDFKKLENVIPPDDLVKKYQSTASPLDDKIYQNTFQIKTLAHLRDMLLPKLMSGEVRVKGNL